jgi:hypothetical protein
MPQMGVQAAQKMHSYFQQQKWASLFAPQPHSTGLATDMSDAELSTVGSTGGRYPSAMASRDATQELESADDARPHARRARTQSLTHAQFSPRSTADNPGDFDVHQHYEIVPGPEAAGLTDEDGKRVWKRLQGKYRSRSPSTSTYPAVPVVFSEDAAGGHPSHGDQDEMFPDDYTAGGSDGGSGVSPEHRTESRAATPQVLTRSRRGPDEGRQSREGARHGEREETRSDAPEQRDEARHAAPEARALETAAPAAAAPAQRDEVRHAVPETEAPAAAAQAEAAAHRAVAAAESEAAGAPKATLTPEQALHAWERNHDVDNRAAYHSGSLSLSLLDSLSLSLSFSPLHTNSLSLSANFLSLSFIFSLSHASSLSLRKFLSLPPSLPLSPRR